MSLFDDAVAASRLNPIVAPFTVSRLLVRADVQPDALDAAGLTRALPVLAEGLAVYLQGEELDAALEDLRALAAPA